MTSNLADKTIKQLNDIISNGYIVDSLIECCAILQVLEGEKNKLFKWEDLPNRSVIYEMSLIIKDWLDSDNSLLSFKPNLPINNDYHPIVLTHYIEDILMNVNEWLNERNILVLKAALANAYNIKIVLPSYDDLEGWPEDIPNPSEYIATLCFSAITGDEDGYFDAKSIYNALIDLVSKRKFKSSINIDDFVTKVNKCDSLAAELSQLNLANSSYIC